MYFTTNVFKSQSFFNRYGKIALNTRLKQVRAALNMQQGAFAGKLGILQQQLSKYECGFNKPSIEFLIKLSKIFNVNIHWLLTGEGSMFTDKAGEFEARIKIVKLKKDQLLKIEYED